MDARIVPLRFDATALDGLSERLLQSHHQNNYGGAVKRLNAIRQKLEAGGFAERPGFELNGLKREELIAANSMALHEVYFDVLGNDRTDMPPAFEVALQASFGSRARWQEEFVAMGKALGGGSGWVLLTFSPREGRLINQWASDHAHALAAATPVLALDMYEHAYHIDYGANAAAYVDAFMRNIDWKAVHTRYQQAVLAASAPWRTTKAEVGSTRLIDVRREAIFAQASSRLPGASWRNPANIDAWANDVPAGEPVVVYCVHGHDLSQAAALRLRVAGVDARYLDGGIEEWQASGGSVEPKEMAR